MSAWVAKSSAAVAPRSLKWHGRLLARLIYTMVRAVAATLRYRLEGEHQLLSSELRSHGLFCIWHNRLALSLPIYHRLSPRRPMNRHECFRLAALVSASRDGGLLARVLEHFEVQPVRGSSSRRGPQGLLELTSWAERGYDLAITPDGPRGPRYVIQEGIVALAQLTGLPIVPMSFNVTPKICLKSWDRFQVPIPFARCDIVFGRPVHVPREAGDTERAALRAELEAELNAITRD